MSRPFHGWFVVGAAFVITFIGFGCAYSFSAFIPSLQAEFAASRGSVSLVFALAGFLYFSLGLVSGPLADRWGSRRLAIAGMVVTGIGLASASLARSLFEVCLAYGLGVGLGVGCAYVPVLGAVQRWFVRRRGFASGLAVSGIGVGTLVMPPLASSLIEAVGWREAYVVLGGLAAIVGAGAALLISNDPHAHGLGPDGDPLEPAVAAGPAAQARPAGPAGQAGPAGPARPARPSGMTVREAVRSRRFIGLYLGCLICSFGLFVPFVHLDPYARDHGVPARWAVLLLSMIGIGSTAGRFLLGGVADRMGRGRALQSSFVGMALALVVWQCSTTFWPLAGFALAYGVFYGGFVAVVPALVMDYFGGRNISSIIGILYTSVASGTLIGPLAAGFAFDLTHSYTVPIVVSICANLIAAAAIAWAGRASSGKSWLR